MRKIFAAFVIMVLMIPLLVFPFDGRVAGQESSLSNLPQPVRNWRALKLPGNPVLGRALVLSGEKSCLQCHSLRGVGGRSAPALDSMEGKLQPRELVDMAGKLWNHAAHMKTEDHFEHGEMADLISYLHVPKAK
ncbi:MAG: hypothetical protein HYY65_03900 [Candidatus Tectomicrobia bacterium]|uniref:Cytochrome c domain-containing protein n=1 Tax=Tectimicrobiota bacterium TaxID=2528274 RepID=A0A932LZH6_UNCTE|nr:hypothetical protein [Candidatus Tectomicrobia bacterium]